MTTPLEPRNWPGPQKLNSVIVNGGDDHLMRTLPAVFLSAIKDVEPVEADDGNEARTQIGACDAAIHGRTTV